MFKILDTYQCKEHFQLLFSIVSPSDLSVTNYDNVSVFSTLVMLQKRNVREKGKPFDIYQYIYSTIFTKDSIFVCVTCGCLSHRHTHTHTQHAMYQNHPLKSRTFNFRILLRHFLNMNSIPTKDYKY